MSKKIKHGFTIIALFCTVFLMGRGAGYLQETAAAVSYSENWGLGFGASGTQPTGNASARSSQNTMLFILEMQMKKQFI